MQTSPRVELFEMKQRQSPSPLVMLSTKAKSDITLTLIALVMLTLSKNMITGAAQMDGAILGGQCCRWPDATDAGAHLIGSSGWRTSIRCVPEQSATWSTIPNCWILLKWKSVNCLQSMVIRVTTSRLSVVPASQHTT